MYVFFALVAIIVVALAALAFAVLARSEPHDASRVATSEPADDDWTSA